eukprot:jgi/Phyca11/132647/e_gw1.196.8.1
MKSPEVVVTHGFAPVGRLRSVISPGALTRALSAMVQPEIQVKGIHPHPKICRLVSLWTKVAVWQPERQYYRERILMNKWARAEKSKAKRTAKWFGASRAAALGLQKLEWKRLRRVVGVGPWGEQILLRLKLYAFSLYDPSSGHLGCPHETCV